MGLRFRKSVNIGGFRVNFSKTGVGYSFGGPGFRYTITADGRERVTVSLPGTGISYVEESSSKKRSIDEHQSAVNEGRFHEIGNKSIECLQSKEYEEFISQCQQYLDLEKKYRQGMKYSFIIAICFLFLALLKAYTYVTLGVGIVFVGLSVWFLLRTRALYNNKIKMEYVFDEEPNPYSKLVELMKLLDKSCSLRCATGVTQGARGRVHAGATNLYDLHNIKIEKKPPKLLETNIECYYIKFPKEEFFILPDKILIIKDYKVGTVNTNSIKVKYEESDFRETDAVPRDAKIIGKSWLYVNNNGSPDRRYKNNREVPICLYGELTITSKEGIHVVLIGSNVHSIESFYRKWAAMNITTGNPKQASRQKQEMPISPVSAIPLSVEEQQQRRKLFGDMEKLQEEYELLVEELHNQRPLMTGEEEQKFYTEIVQKGCVTKEIGVVFDIHDYNFFLMPHTEIEKVCLRLQEIYLSVISSYEDYQNRINESTEGSDEYAILCEEVKTDYMKRESLGNNTDLLWCDLCEEINLWTYWQGRGNSDTKILLVGQDWGCAFDDNFDKFKRCIEHINRGDNDIDYAEHTTSLTDVQLIDLFKILGYDLHQRNNDLFFTNLALGYRKKGSSGGQVKEYLEKDVKYTCRLIEILKPQVIICLGKDTFEILASAIKQCKIKLDNFYDSLENGTNYCDVSLNNGMESRIYAVAHCGNYGTMNRKKYSTNVNSDKSGTDLQKEDWLKIMEYLQKEL